MQQDATETSTPTLSTGGGQPAESPKRCKQQCTTARTEQQHARQTHLVDVLAVLGGVLIAGTTEAWLQVQLQGTGPDTRWQHCLVARARA